MHFLELPKVSVEKGDDALQHWGQFFRIHSEQELEVLALTSPTMKQASDALWWVSEDPNSRQLVEMRELADRAHRHTMAAARAEGKAEGHVEGLRREVQTLVTLLGLDWPAARQAHVASMSPAELEMLVEQIVSRRAWPDSTDIVV